MIFVLTWSFRSVINFDTRWIDNPRYVPEIRARIKSANMQNVEYLTVVSYAGQSLSIQYKYSKKVAIPYKIANSAFSPSQNQNWTLLLLAMSFGSGKSYKTYGISRTIL